MERRAQSPILQLHETEVIAVFFDFFFSSPPQIPKGIFPVYSSTQILLSEILLFLYCVNGECLLLKTMLPHGALWPAKVSHLHHHKIMSSWAEMCTPMPKDEVKGAERLSAG